MKSAVRNAWTAQRTAPVASQSPGHAKAKHWSRSRVGLIIGVTLILLLVAARLALPYVLREAINRRLSRIPDYSGHVDDIRVGLWRGAYSLHGLTIVKQNGRVEEPFFSARHIEFSLAWRELFRKKVVSDIYADGVKLNFVKGPDVSASQLNVDRRWQDVIDDIFPIHITLLKITDGQLRFVNNASEPKIDVSVSNAAVLATGLRNRPSETGEAYPAFVGIEGNSIGGGKLKLALHAEPLAAAPHFYLKLQMEGVSLPALNNLLMAYGGVDVSGGMFKLYLETAAREGRYQGYFKPFFEHVSFRDSPEQRKPLTKEIWEGIVSFAAKIFRNKKRDSVATRVPFSGEFGKMNTDTWDSFVKALHHGFVQALPEKLDSSANADSGEIAQPLKTAEKAADSPKAGKK